MNIKPLKNRVLIRKEKLEDEKKVGGFVVQTKSTEKQTRGEIVAIGSEVTEVKVGQTVIFGKYAPDEEELDGVKYLIVDEQDLIAIYEE